MSEKQSNLAFSADVKNSNDLLKVRFRQLWSIIFTRIGPEVVLYAGKAFPFSFVSLLILVYFKSKLLFCGSFDQPVVKYTIFDHKYYLSESLLSAILELFITMNFPKAHLFYRNQIMD